jgi:hypothetical protein
MTYCKTSKEKSHEITTIDGKLRVDVKGPKEKVLSEIMRERVQDHPFCMASKYEYTRIVQRGQGNTQV